MVYSEKEYNLLGKKLRKTEKDIKLKDREIKILKEQNKQKDELINDLDKYNYRNKYQAAQLEIAELKKTEAIRRKIGDL